MSTSRVRTKPDLSLDSPLHISAKELGDEQYRLWQRNVIDEFKPLSEKVIRDKLQVTSFPYAILIENWNNDFNIASCFRNANAFNAKEVFYIGDKRFDKRGMQGVHNYMDITFLHTISDLLALKDKYNFIGIDNIKESISLNEFIWQPNTLMIFGSEGVGLTPEMVKMCNKIVHINQYGSVRSLNAATASGIVMNDFVTKIQNRF